MNSSMDRLHCNICSRDTRCNGCQATQQAVQAVMHCGDALPCRATTCCMMMLACAKALHMQASCQLQQNCMQRITINTSAQTKPHISSYPRQNLGRCKSQGASKTSLLLGGFCLTGSTAIIRSQVTSPSQAELTRNVMYLDYTTRKACFGSHGTVFGSVQLGQCKTRLACLFWPMLATAQHKLDTYNS